MHEDYIYFFSFKYGDCWVCDRCIYDQLGVKLSPTVCKEKKEQCTKCNEELKKKLDIYIKKYDWLGWLLLPL